MAVDEFTAWFGRMTSVIYRPASSACDLFPVLSSLATLSAKLS
jgi:hypothetical protein